jgi:hypothetical protein
MGAGAGLPELAAPAGGAGAAGDVASEDPPFPVDVGCGELAVGAGVPGSVGGVVEGWVALGGSPPEPSLVDAA